jgi:glycosyltransferase involved in cell wall biosynthesis
MFSRASHRVLIVAPQPFYEDRGTPIAVNLVLEALFELHYKVDMLTYPVGSPIDIPALRIFRAGQSLRVTHVPIGLSMRKLLLDATLIPALWRQLQQEQYCCIHAVEEAAFLAIMAAKKHHIPVIYDMQSSLPEQLLKHRIFQVPMVQKYCRLLERWLIRNTDFVLCSAGLEQYVRALHPAVNVREWFFPSAAMPTSPAAQHLLRAQLGITAQERVVLYTGNSEPYQGLSKLLQAVPAVLAKIPNAVFVLVGITDPAAIDTLLQTSNAFTRKALRIIGRQPQQTMPQYMAMADILVTPREPLGNIPLKIFDYMAAGKPIVATDCAASRTVLNEDRAMLVRPTAQAFAEAIVYLLHDRKEAAHLGTVAQQYASEKLGWKPFVELIKHAYQCAQEAKVHIARSQASCLAERGAPRASSANAVATVGQHREE